MPHRGGTPRRIRARGRWPRSVRSVQLRWRMNRSARPTVLVVEDEDDVREMMELAVGGRGYHVVTAASGHEAVEVMETTHPDVVLLDLMLPGMDGWQVRAHMLGRPDLADVPVVVITAMGDLRGERWEALQPAELVTKPIQFRKVYELLERHCGRAA